MNSKWITLAALWIASLAAAYFVGQKAPEDTGLTGSTAPSTSTAQAKTDASEDDESALAGSGADIAAAAEAVAKKSGSAFTALENGNFSREAWMLATLEALNYNPAQLQDALGKVLAMPAGRERNALVYQLLARWGSLDPINALAYASSIQSIEMRNRGTGEVLQGWAMRDPVSAINWLNTNGTEFSARIYGDYLEDIVQGYAQSNPQSAFQFVSGLPDATVSDRRIKEGALREVIDAMVEQNQVNQALDLTLAMEASSSRDNALSRLVNEWAERDPAAALKFVESMAEDSAYGDMQRSLLRSWADDDPAAAAKWLSSLDPETNDQARLATSLVANWTRYDMEAAANWLNTLPQSPDLDRAVGIFSMRAAQDDPAAALTWASSVSDDQSRERLEKMILPMLREQDNEAFEAYLADSDYSDDKKAQYRELQIQEGRRGYGGGRWR
ncbi:hypothetical protein [Cerasicoccus arenae]|uniref:HEAT repeat domain-containing protein n=1 Tax=Cerasicoccus arenae TaxID=424488 RepID=A0A8J3GFL9_9BACT|nr:hypothetical protein [Cerasicoccus arenae]MBK1859968.1 hypothetical protein [Cerasicoccus arenae]GHC12640.1 hypothetical protein GCM10007047_32520 [Cerasicoccus arenae]